MNQTPPGVSTLKIGIFSWQGAELPVNTFAGAVLGEVIGRITKAPPGLGAALGGATGAALTLVAQQQRASTSSRPSLHPAAQRAWARRFPSQPKTPLPPVR